MSKFLKKLNQKRREKKQDEDRAAAHEARYARIRRQHLDRLTPIFQELVAAKIKLRPSDGSSLPGQIPARIDEIRTKSNFRLFLNNHTVIYIYAALAHVTNQPYYACKVSEHGNPGRTAKHTTVDGVAEWLADIISEYEYKPPRVPEEDELEEDEGRQRVIELGD